MIENKKITVIMPAYNSAKTLRQTVHEIPRGVVDDIILVDDNSRDDTIKVAEELGLFYVRHPENRGYGGNQKTCYKLALERGADIIIMLHPDYQYNPRLVSAMASMVIEGTYDVVLGSRMLLGSARKGGMPLYKYIANVCLTTFQNLIVGQRLSEYHTGFRSYKRKVLESIPYQNNSDDFIFDNQFLCQAIWKGFQIGEISCPAKYFDEGSSISLQRSTIYGLGVVWTSLVFLYAKLVSPKGTIFDI
ncbi:MAG: glycosyltransferase family 2 protein [Alphaproteobacteria bacterium]